MGICVPKHIVCDWYKPVFVPGTTPCTLQLFNETRARVLVGGTLFRSVQGGTNDNNIQISSKWQVGNGSPPAGFRDYDPGMGDTLADVIAVKLTYIDSAGNTNSLSGAQKWTFDGDPQWSTNGIDGIRSSLSLSNIITLPLIDEQTVGTGTGTSGTLNIWDALGTSNPPTSTGDQGDHLAEFPLTDLTGGSSAPSDTAFLNSIRTGPAMTMIYINNGDTNIDGSASEIRETRYWNGNCYKKYDVNNPDCEDPAQSTGSPPTGPPLSCELGPGSDC